MTILESSQLLLKYFGNSTSFEMGADYKKLLIIADKPEESIKASLILALQDFEKAGVVRSYEMVGKNDSKRYWVLNKPFSSYDQSISIDLNLAIMVADIINGYSEKIKSTEYLSDPLNINKTDVEKLAIISKFLLDLAGSVEKDDKLPDNLG